VLSIGTKISDVE